MNLIKPHDYYSPEVFDREFKNVFSDQWLFACMTADVAEPQDYRVVEYMGRSVVIYNARDGIKAFHNVCSQRFNLIFADEKGNSPLVCKHHSREFDRNGELIGEENNNIFSSPDDSDLCLRFYAVAVVGKFVFVNFSAAPAPIKEQLGELHEELLLVSEAIGEKLFERAIPHRVNWKFIVENVIDFQHCRSVHEETFGKLGGCVLPPDEQFRVKRNSYFTFPPPLDTGAIAREKFMRKQFPRKIDNHNYKHILVFPNMTISIMEGFHFTIGQILPLDADNSIYNLQFFTPQLTNAKPTSAALIKEFSKDFPNFADKVFSEDIVYLESLQRGVKEIEHSGFVYESETRLKWFFESYAESMKAKAAV